ncbi:MAG TPA: hypothetical protein VF735_09480 [Pyrinomonadaceae bacterium]|jgi:hypothetical protein
MLRFNRPPQPSDFDKKVARHRETVQKHLEAVLSATAQAGAEGMIAPGGKRQKKEAGKKKSLFQSRWSDFKDIFSKAQFGKCAYCEVSVIGAQHGDVDHYYPKGEVHALEDDRSTWGRERPYVSSVEGRSPRVLCTTGYWWLAYDWSNYLLSCMVCNEYWKGAIFPVEDDPRKLPPASDISEAALLLNPFEDINPIEHLSFDSFGQIQPANDSRHGFETIRTCGLDRPSLIKIRGDIAREAYELTNRLRHAETPAELSDILYSLYLKGVETNHHPGMVRIIIEQQHPGLTWPLLVELVASLLTSELLEVTEPDKVRDILWKLYGICDIRLEHSGRARAIVHEQCGKDWETLVRELASSYTRSFNASDDEKTRVSALRFLHEMGSSDDPHSTVVRSIVESDCGLRWQELEIKVALGAWARPT